MPCYYPMIRDKQTGKVLGSSDNINIKNPSYQLIPCNRCIGCRIEYSRQWAERCMCESKMHPENKWFLTLTYDDEHLPTDYSLNRKDFSRFLDTLRHHKEGIRYFGCGEYGEQFQRPHYHLLVWELPIDDLEYARKSKTGLNLYKSETLNKRWGRGEVIIGEVNWETSAYVARYVTKKHTKEENEDLNRENEFIAMSRMPGIGREYYDEHKDEIYRNDELCVLGSNKQARMVRPPKYFDRLKKEQDGEHSLDKIKRKREISARRSDRIKQTQTTIGLSDQMKQAEDILKVNLKALTRPIE